MATAFRRRSFAVRVRPFAAASVAIAGVATSGCGGGAKAGDPEPVADVAGALLPPGTATLTIARTYPEGCDACFDVTSSKDVGFVAVDAKPCASGAPAITLYTVAPDGSRQPVSSASVGLAGNGRACAGIPPDATKLDELAGRHFVVCVADAGFDSPGDVHVFAKSGRSCADASFAGTCDATLPTASVVWNDDFGLASFSKPTDVAADAFGNAILARRGASWEAEDHRGIRKLNPSGTPLWHRAYGEAVATDLAGNVYVAGAFTGALDVGLGTLESEAGADVVVAKLDPDGAPIWAHRIGTPEDDAASSIAVFRDGDVVVSGGGIGTRRVSPEGDVLWSKPFHGDVAIDGDDAVIVSGAFSGAIDLGEGTVEARGSSDAFVAKLASDGTPLWSRVISDAALPIVAPEGYTITTPEEQVGKAVAIDPSGAIFIAGESGKTISLFGEEHVFHDVPEGSGGHGVYVAKLDPAGNPLWKLIRETDYVDGLAADRLGNVVLSGGVEGHVLPFRYPVLEKFDGAGALAWRREGGGFPPGTLAGTGNAVALDRCGNALWSSTDRIASPTDPSNIHWLATKVSH